VAWGSGLVWNPTDRLEPAKNATNPGLEQEGVWAARMDWVPASWASVILVAARGATARADLPIESREGSPRVGALRARFLVKNTDVAVVLSGGRDQDRLLGFDVGRNLGGRLALHAEGAFTRGAELPPPRGDSTFFRLDLGGLFTDGDTALSFEYLYNGEGYSDAATDLYLGALDAASRASNDPRLEPAARARARQAYLAGVAVPYSGALGLRRHYLHAGWTRTNLGGKWTAVARTIVAPSDGGVALTPGVGYAPRGDVTIQLDAVLLFGPASSEYRLSPVRGGLQARVKVLF
jgi:hypothetical protein